MDTYCIQFKENWPLMGSNKCQTVQHWLFLKEYCLTQNKVPFRDYSVGLTLNLKRSRSTESHYGSLPLVVGYRRPSGNGEWTTWASILLMVPPTSREEGRMSKSLWWFPTILPTCSSAVPASWASGPVALLSLTILQLCWSAYCSSKHSSMGLPQGLCTSVLSA